MPSNEGAPMKYEASKKLSQFLLIVFSFMCFVAEAQTQFVVIGDTGKDNDGQKQVAEAISRHCQKETCHFGMLTGDNIYPGGMSSASDPILDTMFKKYYAPLKFPFFITLGNHDYGKLSNDWTRGAFQLGYARKNPQYHLPHFFYYHEMEDLVLLVLDSTRLMWDKDFDSQEILAREAFAKARGKWFVVLAHHPYLSNGNHGNAGRYEGVSIPSFISGTDVKKFIERNICGKSDLYISGHDHNLQLTDGRIQQCPTLFAVSGAGASTEDLKGRNPVIFQSESLGFVTLSIDKKTLRIRFFDSKNRLLSERELKK
jgi:tartrate-resistant acid phosphatase type 5